jgi:hypothetical protein
MAFQLWARTCRGGDGRSGVTLWRRGGILLWRRGGILAGWGGVLLWRGGVLLQWGVGCGGSSVRVLVDDASEHVLHSPQRLLKNGCRVFRFDYGGGWQRCTESRRNSEDGGDVMIRHRYPIDT